MSGCSRCKDIHHAQLTGYSNLSCKCNCHSNFKNHPDVKPIGWYPAKPLQKQKALHNLRSGSR